MKFSTVWFVGATTILLSDSSSFVLGKKIPNKCDAIKNGQGNVEKSVCKDNNDCEVEKNGKQDNCVNAKKFENLGTGYCRDSEGNFNDNWDYRSGCVGLNGCVNECKDRNKCIGISWAKNPSNDDDGCRNDGRARCVVYLGTVPPIEKTSVNEFEEYTCLRYGNQPASVPTDAPTNAPTNSPTDAPTNAPTNAPTAEPTDAPTNAPTAAPTDAPTDAPSAGPSVTPRGVCENEKNYQLDGKDCNKLSKKGECNKKDDTNNFPPFDETKKVKFFCPAECDSTCWTVRGDCENEPNYQLKNKDCDQWAKKDKCDKKDKTNTYPPFGEVEKVKFFCPLQCKNACSTNAPTTAPSSNPTPAPSASPTPAPSASPSAAPSESPSGKPSASPSESPSGKPSAHPSESPSASPTTDAPTTSPTSEEQNVSQSPTESSSGSSSNGSSGSGSE
eukprot:CAMPEP_0170854626 /NCGR_PEP_ID=MMETSP0734-20130129/13338_1 /TAXON_ID=186038 /ORGANISM="Fragilariopsis kerguelensis, Strain L26-C5" /LENGTH=443 /DNA_ID=CAMNT_0011225767 /DNA_START=160 /DNA_END=1491 /DNA_ORIENTATION=-